jgi:hypothetical protein
MTLTIEENRAVDEKLIVFEQRMDQKLTSVASSMDKLASSVQLLAERDIRTQERESNQQQFNLRLGNSMDNLVKELSAIQLARAEERHAIDAIKRAHPWILVFAVLGPILATAAIGFLFKPAPSQGDQRLVVPITQTYDPQNIPKNAIRSPAPQR